MSLAARFWSKVAQVGNVCECWPWVASRTRGGYGMFRLSSAGMVLAHRQAYKFHFGSIPDGMHLDHLCRDRACCNPFHLEPVTQAENSHRGNYSESGRHVAARTHCPSGHPYDEKNTHVSSSARQKKHRQCRECAKLNARRYRADRRARLG